MKKGCECIPREKEKMGLMYRAYFTVMISAFLVFLFVFSPPSAFPSLSPPPSPLLLLLCLHLLLLPLLEQTAAKSLNIPNIQRNPGRSLSPSVWLYVACSHIRTGIHMPLAESLSLTVTCRNLHVSRSFSPSA